MTDVRTIKTFPQLIKFLRDELDWPIEGTDFEELTFDYAPEELGLDAKTAVKIKEIKQLRPLESNQPWGIFFVNFEPQRLPVVALRRILRSLVLKKRQAASRAQQATWQLHDLMFISSYGEAAHRDITFAQFSEDTAHGDLPVLRVLGWDDEDTALHSEYTEKMLRERLRWPKDVKNVEQWRSTWSSAFTLRHMQVIKTSKELAIQLAALASKIRKRARAVLAIESEKGPLRKLHSAFKEALIHDLSEDDFADMYAQTISYGLLTARISRPAGLVADNLKDMVPVTNPFLKELLETFLSVGGRKGKIDFDELGISEVVQLLRDADMEAVLRDFGDRNPQEDPAIHFYELFLKEYDPRKRMQRGVFYTPRPVVSFIVRSVHELLQKEFGLADGLADTATWGEMTKRHKGLKTPEGVSPDEPFVQILDPATGTGTFLVEAIEVIYETMRKKWLKEGHMALEIPNLWNEYVPEHLLPRIYGFELLMAPYSIAHMKVGLKLNETGYNFGSEERARIYLTNSLEPPQDFSDRLAFDAPALAHEAQAVNAIKRHQRFTVAIGNPPYSNFGQLNKIPFILDLLDDYKRGLNERKINLDDDFIKFVRLTHNFLTQSGCGVFGMITNNVFLDGLTHRRMRESILSEFPIVAVMDLHGNAAAQETDLDGGKDENVFDITQGVAITVMCRPLSSAPAKPSVSFRELRGSRASKYAALRGRPNGGALSLSPSSPYFFLVPKDLTNDAEYRRFSAVTNIFREQSYGIQTKRDALTVAFSAEEVLGRAKNVMSMSDETVRAKYDLAEDGRDWAIRWARADLQRLENLRAHVREVLYRPFDVRWTIYTDKSKGFLAYPRWESMRCMLTRNLALVAMRQVFQDAETYSHFGATNLLIDERTFYSNRGGTYLFPLYADKEADAAFLTGGERARRPNLEGNFAKELGARLGLPPSGPFALPQGVSPEDIFWYTYAVFYSPGYRSRYAEFLKIDFPRLPLTSSLELFRALARLGGELVGLHLLESPKLDKRLTTYTGPASPEVEKASYARETVWLDKAQTRGFRSVPEAVWTFHLGGYQVCEKWLKDRKGRTLSKQDIEHYHRIIVAISETIGIMGEIDKVIEAHGGWPGAFVTGNRSAPESTN